VPPPGKGEHHGASGEQQDGEGLSRQSEAGEGQQHRNSRRSRTVRSHRIDRPQGGSEARHWIRVRKVESSSGWGRGVPAEQPVGARV
jgi:hypothetical protein